MLQPKRTKHRKTQKGRMKDEGGYLLLKNGEMIPVSVRKKAEVLARLTGG